MKSSFILAACAAALAAAPAQAQPVAADLLPAYEVNTIVASMGMRPIGRPAWMRGRYVVAAVDRYGRDVNVVLDARDGQVLAVHPLGRGRFGPPPPGYATRAAPYDPMDRPAPPPPPSGGPGAPQPAEDGEFFDNDRQQGSLPPPRPTARTTPPARDPSVTGGITRTAPTERKEAAPSAATPVPRPRPALAKASDPGNKPTPVDKPVAAAKPDETKPAATPKPVQAEAKAEVKPEPNKREAGKPKDNKPQATKPETKQASAPQTEKPGQAKPEVTSKPEAPKPDVRVIDLSKPKTAPKPEDKPGEAIRF